MGKTKTTTGDVPLQVGAPHKSNPLTGLRQTVRRLTGTDEGGARASEDGAHEGDDGEQPSDGGEQPSDGGEQPSDGGEHASDDDHEGHGGEHASGGEKDIERDPDDGSIEDTRQDETNAALGRTQGPALSLPTKIKNIVHQLIQEGDTYGLIYALLMNEEEPIDGIDLRSTFFINQTQYESDASYKSRVDRRLAYFDSFGLRRRGRVRLVRVSFVGSTQDGAPISNVRAGDGDIWMDADPNIFGGNTRKVSHFITKSEFDPGKKKLERELRASIGDSFDTQRTASSNALNSEMRKVFQLDDEAIFDGHKYISDSTKYLRNSAKKLGASTVTRTLQARVLQSTKDYTPSNQTYLDAFMERLTRAKEPYGGRGKPNLILFWIRGAKPSELAAIMTKEASGEGVGKPQHHTNLALYKQMRALARRVARGSHRPAYFIPIGDVLSEHLDASETHEKGPSEDKNLIRFFDHDNFKGAPMGKQINFLVLLMQRYNVMQIGMRSGSLERLMYLGAPTIYFDRTLGEETPTGATRIKELTALSTSESGLAAVLDHINNLRDPAPQLPPKGFTGFYHVENNDTGLLKYTAIETTIKERISKALEAQKTTVQALSELRRRLVQKPKPPKGPARDEHIKNTIGPGGLTPAEEEKLEMLLWAWMMKDVPVSEISGEDPLYQKLNARKGETEQARAEKLKEREDKKNNPPGDLFDDDDFGLDFL